jgi:3-oxoacyl-[acyl-carrier-protein] synthase II
MSELPDNSGRRVVITGMGVICPLGSTTGELWDALCEGRSGVGPLTRLASAAFPMDFGAEADQFEGKIDDFGPLAKDQKKAIRKGLKVMCRECQMGVAVAQLAMDDAGFGPDGFDPERAGVNFGTDYVLSIPEEFTEGILACLDERGRFEFSRWAVQGMPKMSPLWLLKYLPNMPASHIAIYNQLRGPNNSITMREAAANLAVRESFHIIAEGRADMMLAGATGSRIHPMKTIHAVEQEELAGGVDPARASRPFDRDRTGMVLGEGAAAVILEELSTAQARGATIYAEVLQGASSSVVGPKLLACRDQAIKNVLQMVLLRGGLSPDRIGHLHAHGLGTRVGDAEEAWAIDQVFGRRADPLPVTAAKSYFGNLGAGGGLVEMVASILALRHDRLFPILNYENPDPQCPVAAVTDGQTTPGDSFINLSVTPQGQASAVLVQRFA